MPFVITEENIIRENSDPKGKYLTDRELANMLGHPAANIHMYRLNKGLPLCPQELKMKHRITRNRICPECGKEFYHEKKAVKFCGFECSMVYMNKLWEKKIYKKICSQCNKEYEASHKNRFKKYCSDKCKAEGRIKIKLPNMKCINCGKEYYTENLDKDTCTLKCKREAKLIKVICPICNKEFNTPRTNLRKFCGTECYGIGMIKEQDKQGNIEMPTRMFALFILKLRETNKEAYSQTIGAIREEMTGVKAGKHFIEDTPNRKEWESYNKKFQRVLGKMQIKIRKKPFDEKKAEIMRNYQKKPK
jgi:endogenous inhibitor of DNA gyrase (YacG/DUF329 family)